MRKNILLLDIDGCILDFYSKFIEFCDVKHAQRDDIFPHTPIADELSNLFCEDEMFSTLPLIEGARESLQRIREKYEIHLISAANNTNNCVALRQRNLDFYFGKDFFNSLTHTNYYENCKYDALKKYPEMCIFVDDHQMNLETGWKAGHFSILLDVNYAENEPHPHWPLCANSWNSLETFLGV